MEIAVRRTLLSRVRPVLRALGAFSGLVTGLCWVLVLAPWGLGLNGRAPTPGEFASAVLVNWVSTVVAALVIPGLHLFLSQDFAERFGPRARLASTALALVAWPLLLLDPGVRGAVGYWGLPLALLLALFGWYRGGMVATREQGTAADRAIERVGIAVTTLFILAFVATVGLAWSQAMLGRG